MRRGLFSDLCPESIGRSMAAPRWPALDGLRGLAILLVLVAHSQLFPAVTAGMLGVTLFFVLSGFLITFLLLGEKEETGRSDLTAFYARRAPRLLPALFIYLAGIAVLAAVLVLEVPIWDMTWATRSVCRELCPVGR